MDVVQRRVFENGWNIRYFVTISDDIQVIVLEGQTLNSSMYAFALETLIVPMRFECSAYPRQPHGQFCPCERVRNIRNDGVPSHDKCV